MKKYLKFFLLFSFLGLIGSLSFINFFHYKMKNELHIYVELNQEILELDDTYSLCVGLLSTNPSKKNIDSCNLVFNKLKKKTIKIKNECPYIYFYTSYINNI